MKTNLKFIKRAALLVLLSTINSHLSTFAQGTAFTYQGRLNDGASPANGNYDLRLIVYDNSVGGSQQGPILTNSATAVSNGLFTATLDFGAIFPGGARWLEIAVRTNGGSGFAILTPRQNLTPAPYAITAGNVAPGAGLSGTYGSAITLSNAGNSFSGNGAGLANVNATTLGGLSSSNFWKSAGNAGTVPGANFVGTTDNQPLELRVNGGRAFRLEPTVNDANHSGIINVIGGSPLNYLSNGVYAATISGGGAANFFGVPVSNSVIGDFGTVSGGAQNTAALFGTVGGGTQNTAGGSESVVDGGQLNTASGILSTIGGGQQGTASGNGATVGGGEQNNASGGSATVAGGRNNNAISNNATVGGGIGNTASGQYATVPGGLNCTAAGTGSFAAGTQAKANHLGSFVWADNQPADFASQTAGQFLIRASGGVGIGLNNPNSYLHVASAGSIPQFQITQNAANDFTRLRMNVVGSPSWEMDVSSGPAPSISWWTGTLRMNLDYNGNLTTSGTVNGTSDRNAKEKFIAVSSRVVLDKVAALPISEWNFKNEPATRHIGPMAQDFYAAFNVGMDDKHIATVDEGGVALAPIQGLNQKLEEQCAENAELKQQLGEIKETLRRLSKEKGNQP